MGAAVSTATAGLTDSGGGFAAPPLMAAASSGLISNVASSTTSRKHSASLVSAIDTPPARFLTTGNVSTSRETASTEGTIAQTDLHDLPIPASTAVAAAAAASLVVSARFEPISGDPDMRRRSLPNSFADCFVSSSQLKEYVQNMVNTAMTLKTGENAVGGDVSNCSLDTTLTNIEKTESGDPAFDQPYAQLQQTATNSREKRIRQQSACVCTTDTACLPSKSSAIFVCIGS